MVTSWWSEGGSGRQRERQWPELYASHSTLFDEAIVEEVKIGQMEEWTR